MKNALLALRGIPLWCWPLLLVVILFLAPIVSVLSSLLSSPSDSWAHLIDTQLGEYISNSTLLVLGVAIGVLILGVSSAWLIASCQFKGRKLFEWLLLLPLAMPAYIIAYTYTGLLDYSGAVQQSLRSIFNWGYGDYYFPEVRSLGGAVIMMSLVLYPYVYLLARTAFASQSANMHDAAKSLGKSSWQRFYLITLPIARPAIIAGLALALMETLADYGTVQYFGVNVLSTGIFRIWFGLNDVTAASQLAGILLLFVLVLLGLERYARQNLRYSEQSSQRILKPTLLNRKQNSLAIAWLSIIVSLGFIIPFIQLAYWAITHSSAQFNSDYWQLVANSVSLAAITAAAAVIIALMLAYMQRLAKNPLISSSVFTSSLGYAVPGTVIAIGVLVPFTALDHHINNIMESYFGISTGLLLSGSLIILVFAYLIRFLAIALGNIQASMLSISSQLDEASRSLGYTPSQTVAKVHLPILKTSIITSALLVFVDTLKELPATLVLRPFNFNTLAVRSYELANDEQLANAAPTVITIVLAGLLPVILLNASLRKQQRHTQSSTNHTQETTTPA